MNWLVVDAGSRFIRAAGGALGRLAVLRDLRRRQQLCRPSRFVVCDDDAYLYWAAVDVAGVKRVGRDLTNLLTAHATLPACLSDGVVTAALARLCAEYRVEFSCDPEGIAVIAPSATEEPTSSHAHDFRYRLERACAHLGLQQCRVVEPMSAVAQSAGGRSQGVDVIVDWGASGIRVGLVEWRSGQPMTLSSQAICDPSGVRPGSHEHLTGLWRANLGGAASADIVQWLADETLRPGQATTRVEFKEGQALLLAVSDFQKHQILHPADVSIERLVQRLLVGLDDSHRSSVRMVLAGGGAESLAARWNGAPSGLGSCQSVGPMAALTGALDQSGRWPVSVGNRVDEIGWMVPKSRLARGGRRPMEEMEPVPVIDAGKTVGHYAGPGCYWLAPEATLYVRRGGQTEHFTLTLPQGFQVAETPWLELTLVGVCGSSVAMALRTHLGAPARHFVLSHGTMNEVPDLTRRWVRNQHAP